MSFIPASIYYSEFEAPIERKKELEQVCYRLHEVRVYEQKCWIRRDDRVFTLSAELTFHISHSTSLKDKRQVRRSLIEKTRHRFNVSIAEIGTQDVHQTLTIGIAVVSGDASHRQESINEIVRFMESQANAELMSVVIDE